MKKNILVYLGAVICLLSMSGCTATDVRPIDGALNLTHVCIEENEKVKVSDFITVLREGFDRHSISTEVFSGATPSNCEYTLDYTALRSWDLAPYMSEASLNLRQDGRSIASARYHLKGKGGFALTKFQGTRKKLAPVIDELLQHY